MPTNWYWFLIVGLVPMIVGFVYYNKNTVGQAWMNVNGFKDEDLEGGNMAIIFGVSYLLSILMAFILSSFVIHQGGVFSMMVPDVMVSGSEVQNEFNALMVKYGENSRSFGHGAAHGLMILVFFVFPLITINALFERRGWKYIFIHTGYWLICLILMGGLICQFLEYAPMT